MNKKKIIFFCPSMEDGGVEKNLINIANNLINFYEIIVITSNLNKKKFFDKKIKFISPRSNFFNNTNRIIKGSICFLLSLRYLTERKLTIISFQANVLAIIISKIIGSKIIIRSNASPNYYAKSKLKRIFMSFFYKLSNNVIVNSEDFKREFKLFFNVKAVKIYNPIENIKILKKKSKKKIKFNFFDKHKKFLKILSIGRLVYQKDHLTILRALNLIKGKKKFKFCLIGKGNQKENLKIFIRQNDLENNVKLLGYKKNVYPYYKKADLFILSSLYEGLPNTLLEASALGVPIVATDCKTGPREIITKRSDTLFKIKDYKYLAKVILNSKIKRKKIFYNDKRFDFKKNLKRYKDVINNLK